MCGLVTMVSTVPFGFVYTDSKIFFEMLLLNSLRGRHSTGVAGIYRDGNVDLLKVVGHPFVLEEYKLFDLWKTRIFRDYWAILGHGRYANVGHVTPKNAHPFIRGDITLIHNGKLDNFKELREEYQDGENVFQVDSDVFANMLHDSEEEALKKIRGGTAAIWYNNKDKKVKFIRNYERPLSYLVSKDKIVVASESKVLEWIKLSGINGQIKEATPGVLYEIGMNEQIQTKTIEGFIKVNRKVFWSGLRQSPYDDDDVVVWPNSALYQKKEESKPPVEIGDNIEFSLHDYKELIIGDNIIYALRGKMLNNTDVEVRYVYRGKIEDVFDVEFMSGKVCKVLVNRSEKKYLAFVEDLEKSNESVVQ